MREPDPGTVQSIRQRLLNRAREQKEDFQLTLVRYGVERFLYRLSLSGWADDYVVKGATLFDVWLKQSHRPTRDLDMTRLDVETNDQFEGHLRQICEQECPEDGLVFDLSSLTVEPIRKDQEGQGARAKFLARLGKAKIPIQLDVGVGDVVTPAPRLEEFPTLLGLPAPRVKLYPRETFIAEKFEAMVRLGRTNSRYKDFSDVALLAEHVDFDGTELLEACSNTFARRGTPVEPGDPPEALRPSFYTDETRAERWDAFAQENLTLERLGSFPKVGEVIASFLTPLWNALASGEPWNSYWEAGGPWRARL